MLIRCDKCSTLYELDESLLPRHGAPVQCSKCQFVFTAYPATRPPPEVNGEALPAGPGEGSDAPPTYDEPVASDGSSSAASARGSASYGTEADLAPAPGGAAATRAARSPSPGAGAGGALPATGGDAIETGRSGDDRAARRGPAGAFGDKQFTPDGRPIRKVPFPTEELGATPRGASPRPVPTRGLPAFDRKALVWLVPIGLAVLLLLALAAWRLLGRSESAPPRVKATVGALSSARSAASTSPM